MVKYCQISGHGSRGQRLKGAYKRQEDDLDNIFEFLGHSNREVAFPWDNESGHESTYRSSSDSTIR